MSSWIKVFLLSAALCFVLVNSYAQAPVAGPQTKDKTEQMIDEAHRGLFQAQPNAASQAGQLTNDVAAALPRPGAAENITRKNIVDEQIFGRMERDKIPHAVLSTDEEFIRRLYVDATGQLPSVEALRQFTTDKHPGPVLYVLR